MKSNLVSLTVALALIGGAFWLSNGSNYQGGYENNVKIVNGVQIVELRAKGGYGPEKSVAKAGIPTVLRVNTEGTFDCSSIVRIPSLKISKNLPPSGVTDIDLGTPEVVALQGTCGMGMYPFEIDFQS